MINLKYEVWMNGIPLSSISGNIYISSIAYKPPAMSVITSVTVGRDGEQVDSVRHKGASVTVSFYLKQTENVNRQDIVEAIAAWAKKGVLQTSDKPYKRLHVLCTEPPYVPEVCDWSKPISMTFQAYEYPFWEEDAVSQLTLTGSSGSGSLYVPGNAGSTLVEVTVTPSGSMANITLTVGSTSITLTDVSASSASPVTVSYDENGYLRIRCGTTSILSKRTGSDDLLAECGTGNTVSFSASAAVTVTFRARGLWL